MGSSWLVVYTKPRHEKKSHDNLTNIGIEVFLPLQKELRQWSDRKKWVEKPLFPGYLFVKISEKDYLSVLNCQGIVKYIFYNGRAATVDDKIINGIKNSLEPTAQFNFEITDKDLSLGQEIDIKTGPFKGITGRIVQFKGKQKIAIEIECMNRRILIETTKRHIG